MALAKALPDKVAAERKPAFRVRPITSPKPTDAVHDASDGGDRPRRSRAQELDTTLAQLEKLAK